MNSKNDNTKNVPIKSRKYKTLKNEIGSLNYSISFQRDYLLGMLNNLSYMNNIKLFQDTDSLFMSMLNELKIIKEELDKIVKDHNLWLESDYSEGERADLSYTDLIGADLSGANLGFAKLQGADLRGADLDKFLATNLK